MTNSREKCRTVAAFSDSGPTMNPGVSHSETTGSRCASHSCRKRAALSAASASMAPPRWVGTLAMTPSGAPGGVVGDADVDDAVGVLDVDRPDLLGGDDAEPAALDHRRAAHADVGVLGGDDDV